jgi:hypothetical protein
MSDVWQKQQDEARHSLAEYRAGKVERSWYSSLICQWGKVGLLEARSDIEPFLYDSDNALRQIALTALTCWLRLQDYWPIAVNFLLYDPDYMTRTTGADALAYLKSKTQDQRTLGILSSVVRDPYEDESIRWDAYSSMCMVTYGKWEGPKEPAGQHFDLDRDADWDLINASVDSEQEKLWHEEAQRLLTSYQAGQVAATDFYAMLRRFARARLQESQEVVRGFLASPSKLLRTTALSTLILYLQVPGNWQMAVDLIEHDPAIRMQLKGIEWLALLMQKTRDQKTLRLLYKYWMRYDRDLSLIAMEAIDKVYSGDFEDFLASMKESPDQTE